MIIYDLCCDNEHRFEGWFQSAEDFESQLKRHLVNCPQCDSSEVRRVPCAVAISTPKETSGPLGSPSEKVTAAMPAGNEAAMLYHRLAGMLMAASEDVGADFAEEARRIHYKEAPERPIRGQTTDEEYSALQEEGIDVIRLPAAIKKENLS